MHFCKLILHGIYCIKLLKKTKAMTKRSEVSASLQMPSSLVEWPWFILALNYQYSATADQSHAEPK